MCVEIHLYTNYTNMYINSFGCFLKEIWVKGKKKAKDKFHFKRHAMTIVKLWNFLSRCMPPTFNPNNKKYQDSKHLKEKSNKKKMKWDKFWKYSKKFQ